MAVTVNMLAEHFGEAVVCRPAKGDKRFSWPALIASLTLPKRWPETISGTKIDTEALYCGNERSAADFLETNPGAYALAVGDGRLLNDMSPSVRDRLLLVHEVGSFAEIFERVRLYMLVYEKWILRMKQTLLDGGGYQALLDCSKEIFDDFISITDSSFRLVASTENPPDEDEVARHLVQKGYHAKETILLFREYKAIKRWRSQRGIVQVTDTHIVNSPSLSYVFRMHGDYFVHMVLQSKHGTPSPALVDTFQMLVDHITLYVRHDWLQQHRYSNDTASFLRDLATRHAISDERLREQLEQHGMAFEAEYRLTVVESDENEHEKQLMLGYRAWRLAEFAPLSKVFIVGDKILLLDDAHVGEASHETEDPVRRLDSFCQTFGGAAGISEMFPRIEDLPFAFKQARLALKYGRKTSSKRQKDSDVNGRKNIYFFGDYLTAFIMEDGMHDVPFVNFCLEHGPAWCIRQEDETKGTQDADLLYLYLTHERRPNEAAAVAHLHRNTLVYRMDRLQKRFDLDLDNPTFRERLLLELKLLRTRKITEKPQEG